MSDSIARICNGLFIYNITFIKADIYTVPLRYHILYNFKLELAHTGYLGSVILTACRNIYQRFFILNLTKLRKELTL